MSRRRNLEGAPGVQLGLIVTPMLDMAFQILSFFIATYNPSAMEGHIPGSLVPPENPAMKSKDNKVPQIELPPSVKEDLLIAGLNEAVLVRAKVIVRGQEIGKRFEGDLGQIEVKTSLETDPQVIADTNITVPESLKLLLARLESEIEKAGYKPRRLRTAEDMAKYEKAKKEALDKDLPPPKLAPPLKLVADGELKHEYVMMVYSTAKRAGYDDIHFVPPPVLSTKLK